MSALNQRESTILAAALKLPLEGRPAYLDEACGGDAALRQRIVEALFQAHEDAAATAQAAPSSSAEKTIAVPFPNEPPGEKPGDRIGHYKLLEQIGEGGMGTVWVAEQTQPIRREVALKVIKLGMDTKQVMARFEAERQALALMDHPNIAKVLDAGATETGRPYFVMERVKGIPITDYCDQHNLSTGARLDLFIQVCHAIQHAHQKGIIHRDIKPSNILVALQDGVPVPKVIDFGIAKATSGQRLTELTLHTALAEFIGTPAYMSPEQADLTGVDIDTRSDIYSLGVLLYELLTGRTPFDAKRLFQAGMDGIRRIIREEEPPRPSTRLSTLAAEEQTTTAKRRQTDPPRLVHLVRGDLDWIVMKTLEKDRSRRYDTATGLAADIQRHLNNEPVVARPPSNLYRFQKTVHRNKLAFAAAAAVAAALIIGLGLSTWLFFREKDARQRAVAAENAQSKLRQQAEADEQKAKTEAAKSRQVVRFLKEMLDGVGPSVALGRDTTMLREILDKTAERVGQDLNEQPDVGADMRTTIGEVYYALAEYANAEAMHREAVRMRRQLLGNDNLDLAQSLVDLGVALQKQWKAQEAIGVHREALAIRRKLLGNEHPDVAKSISHLGEALNTDRKFQEAERTLREAATMQRKLLGEENIDLAATLVIFANSLMWNDKMSESETVAREALAISRKMLGNEHPEVALALQVLANTLRREGKSSEAEDLYRESLALRIKLLGNEHPLVGLALGNLVSLLREEGKPAEVASICRKLADQGNAEAQVRLGWMYANGTGVEKDLVEAVKWYRKAAEKGNVNGQFNFAVCYEQGWGVEKDLAEAAKWYRKAAEKGNPGAQKRLAGMFEHGDGVAKDLAEAGKWYRKAAEGYLKTLEASRAAAAQGDTQALNEFAWTFATSESAEVRDGRAAVGLAEKAATATGHKDPMLLDTLAAAYAEVGQFTNAARVQKEGIALLEDRKSKEDYGSRLKLYESNSPYHTVNQSLAPAAESPIQIAALLHARGRLRAQYGQWQEAIPDFTKAIQLNPDDDLIWYLLAPLLLEAGDVEGYRKHRQAFLARFCTTNDPPTAQRIAKGAMLLPLAGPDLAAASNLAEIAVTAGKNDSRVAFSQFVKGLAEYREGHFAHAAEWAKKALSKLGEDSQRDVQAYAVLAMARHKLGQTNEAHAVLANANQVNETKLPKLDSGDLGAAWNNVLIARILLREADTLIGGGGSAGAKP